MRTFHVIFKNSNMDFMSIGRNYSASDMVEAISLFYNDNPNAVLLAVYDLDAVLAIKGT